MTDETPEEQSTEQVSQPEVPQASVPPTTGISATDLLTQQCAKEHKKSLIFMIATGVLAFTTVAAFVFGLSIGSDTNSNHRRPAMPVNGPGRRNPNFPGGGGRGGPAANANLKSRFFNSDGTINQDNVNKFLSRFTGTSKSTFLNAFNNRITQAVSSGILTAYQATALRNALGISGSTS